MRRSVRRLLVPLVTVAAASSVEVGYAAEPDAYPRPGKTERVSVSSNGAQGDNWSGGGWGGDISRDGRFVSFASQASNLVPGDTNKCESGGALVSCPDVFVRDRRMGRTERVSVASDGGQAVPLPSGNGSGETSISTDGRYVAFWSDAPNLVPGDTNLAGDVFVRDRRARRTTRVSVSSKGAQAGPGVPLAAGVSISGDGRYVVFSSAADNLVPNDTNKTVDLFVHDLRAHKTVRVSESSKAEQANNRSLYGSISGNGRYVAFTSYASNMVRGDTTQEQCDCVPGNVYRHDLRTHKTIRVSVTTDGSQTGYGPFPFCRLDISLLPVPLPNEVPPQLSRLLNPSFQFCHTDTRNHGHRISWDGRYVLFKSNATNLVPNDGNFAGVQRYDPGPGDDVFVRDVVRQRTERVSVDSYGHENADANAFGSFSADGRHVLYSTWSPEQSGCGGLAALPPLGSLLGVDPTGCLGTRVETYVYDRTAGVMDWVSLSKTGKPGTPGLEWPGLLDVLSRNYAYAYPHALSGDGRYALFGSTMPDLVSGDTNKAWDAFVRDLGPRAGTGGFGGATSSAEGSGSDQTCVAELCVPPLEASGATGDVSTPSADLIGARVVTRPALRDLFVRLDLAQMPEVAGAPAGGLLYGLRFTAGGQRFEVRVQRVPGADFDPKGGASFGLFRQDRATGLFTKVATLKGGYGTTGASVVFAVPVKELGLVDGGRLSGVRAFTGVGSYLSGVTRVLDSVRLAR